MKKYYLCVMMLWSLNSLGQIRNPEFKAKLDSVYEHDVPLISVAEFLKLDKHNLYVLDAREENEYEVSHLKNARHVGYFWFDMRTIYDIPTDANVVVYCSVGLRSEKIGAKLIQAGYRNVYNLYGSIFEWVNEGLPVYKSNGVQTSELHVYNEDWARWAERGTKVL